MTFLSASKARRNFFWSGDVLHMWAGPNKYGHKCSMWVKSKHLRAETRQRGPRLDAIPLQNVLPVVDWKALMENSTSCYRCLARRGLAFRGGPLLQLQIGLPVFVLAPCRYLYCAECCRAPLPALHAVILCTTPVWWWAMPCKVFQAWHRRYSQGGLQCPGAPVLACCLKSSTCVRAMRCETCALRCVGL